MFPIALDLSKIAVLLVGQGELLARRQKQLHIVGATHLHVLENALPTEQDIAHATVVMVAGLPRDVSETIATAARAAGKLVNVEDVNDLCDFYFTANVTRGDLIIAVSTSGASPTLARKVREHIANDFGPEWEGRTHQIADFRRSLKEQGKSTTEVLAASEEFLALKGWLA
jgi:precorrin-2 dehydrogenase